MSDIALVKPHSLSPEKAKAFVQTVTNGLATKYGLESEWKGNTLHFHRSGVDGRVVVKDADIRINLDLGFLMKPFKNEFVRQIETGFNQLPAGRR